TMADANINAPEVPVAADSPPTRSDEQILPRNKWVPVGKSNCFLDVERTQANPIFKIAMDILKNTNFFKAFTASSTIPSIYIQHIHKFHKRPSSPLHLRYEESALGYLKFSFKNTKRVRFRMAIPDTLISENIQSATYYPEYVAKVAKYQWYLIRVVVSDDETPTPKPAKGTKPKTPRKPKPQSTSSQPPKPKPAPAKP
ncbi:hypothetical protein Tco_0585139, partial [Tanacetum coccineum]